MRGPQIRHANREAKDERQIDEWQLTAEKQTATKLALEGKVGKKQADCGKLTNGPQNIHFSSPELFRCYLTWQMGLWKFG